MTFNGWNIVTMPAAPAAPASMEFSLVNKVAISLSPFTGQQQVYDWQASYLEASISMPPLTHVQAQAWIAFLMLLRGQANVFQIGDPLAVAPQGTALGAPLVDGNGQMGYQIATRAWTAGAAGVLLAGDWLQIGYRLYRNLTTVTADGSGKAVLNIWPQIRESPADGTALVLNRTQGLFRLAANASKYSITNSRNYGLQFEIMEAI